MVFLLCARVGAGQRGRLIIFGYDVGHWQADGGATFVEAGLELGRSVGLIDEE